MARYREKDETDLRWNRIRRRLTMELDVQVRDWREEALNRLLAGAWREYAASLETGQIIELEENYDTWVAKALNESVSLRVTSGELEAG